MTTSPNPLAFFFTEGGLSSSPLSTSSESEGAACRLFCLDAAAPAIAFRPSHHSVTLAPLLIVAQISARSSASNTDHSVRLQIASIEISFGNVIT